MQRLSVRTTGPQLESTLVGLTTSTERSKLAQLAVLMTSLGECVKAQGPGERKMMWVYAALRHLPVSDVTAACGDHGGGSGAAAADGAHMIACGL
jgi:hypothetical protein